MIEEHFMKVKYDFKYRYDPERQVMGKKEDIPLCSDQIDSPVGFTKYYLVWFFFPPLRCCFSLNFASPLITGGLRYGAKMRKAAKYSHQAGYW